MTSPITDGVFAIHKPQSITSAQVLRDLQDQFIPSKYFAEALAAEADRRNAESRRQNKRRKDKTIRVKLGHGGTLDPLATGILICGVGKGTKDLPSFLGCKKTYETVVLFGAATDTYDCEGKVVGRAPYQHITRETTEKIIKEHFIGQIKQVPPIFSALRINGKHAYDYAREGLELPREMAARDMKVDECEIVEWYEPGQHTYIWPKEEAPPEEKEAVKKVYGEASQLQDAASAKPRGTKRSAPGDSTPSRDMSGDVSAIEPEDLSKKQKTSSETPALDQEVSSQGGGSHGQSESPGPLEQEYGPPAVKVRLTVSSGFYVRSFCHDLGIALGSMGLMSSLVRSRQGEFDIADHDNVMSYSDVGPGEEVWSIKLRKLLEQWPRIRAKMVAEKTIDESNARTERQPEQNQTRGDRHVKRDRRNHGKYNSSRQQSHWERKGRDGKGGNNWKSDRQSPDVGRRQNTSSPEP